MKERTSIAPQYNLFGKDKIKYYEKEIPKVRARLRFTSTLEARKRLMEDIEQMEKGLLDERDRLRESGYKRRKWMWWR